MGRFEDIQRMHRQGAETAPLKSKFTTPLDRSSAVEQEGLEIDDRQIIVSLTKALRRLLKEPGKYPLKEVQDNVHAYLENMAESWGAIRSEVLSEGTVNTNIEELEDPEELGKFFENMFTQLLQQDKRQTLRWQAGDRDAIRIIDTLLTSFALLGDKSVERVNRYVGKLYEASRKY